MRLIYFMLASVLVHAMFMAILQLPVHVVPQLKTSASQIKVIIANNHSQNKLGAVDTAQMAKPIPNIKKSALQHAAVIKPKAVDVLAPAAMPQLPVAADLQAITIDSLPNADASTEAAAIDTSNYYAATQVDRKALPQINIDESMLSTRDYSGLPIKLRLYINAYGRVVKIERIGVLDQDVEYVEQLENLLFDITFLPAKRDGLDVDSYQDLLLSFNPLPMIGEPADLN